MPAQTAVQIRLEIFPDILIPVDETLDALVEREIKIGTVLLGALGIPFGKPIYRDRHAYTYLVKSCSGFFVVSYCAIQGFFHFSASYSPILFSPMAKGVKARGMPKILDGLSAPGRGVYIR
jgi:hypothetical protein